MTLTERVAPAVAFQNGRYKAICAAEEAVAAEEQKVLRAQACALEKEELHALRRLANRYAELVNALTGVGK